MHKSPSNKYYVGITNTSVESRWGKDGIRYNRQPYFYRAIQKYGWDNFEHIIIAENLSKEEACKMEVELIKQYNTNDSSYGYNVSIGGECTFAGVKRNPLWRSRISRALMGNRNGVHIPSKEEREKKSVKMKGNRLGAYRRITDEYKRKALISQPNRCIIEQRTLDGELVAVFNSINEAFRSTGIWNIAEASRVGGRSKTAGGYVWVRVVRENS